MAEDISKLTQQELFQLSVASSHSWFTQGAGLLRAAYVLWRLHQTHFDKMTLRAKNKQRLSVYDLMDMYTNHFGSSYMLLAGLAIENAVKGLIISQQNIPTDCQKLPKECKGHDLKALFNTAKLKIDTEEHLIKYLTEAIRWKGRYRTPLDMKEVKTWLSYGGVICTFSSVKSLFVRVIKAYPDNVWKISEDRPKTVNEWLAFINNECPESP